jgi:uncharacterized membrane protein YphA (DoxX/SURF4 family)
MESLTKVGRILFAIPIAAFGVQYLIYGRFVGGLPPVPPWTPGGAFLAYLTGAALIAAGVSIATNIKARLSATLLGSLFFLSVVFLHGLRASDVLHDGVARTRAFEPLALCGAAWVLAGILTGDKFGRNVWDRAADKLATPGRFLFAISMVIFGIQHFMYAPFIAYLIPSWIPGHMFFAYFTGVAFIAAGVSIVIGKYAPLAATLLGIMFLLWAVLLHAPRVAAHLRNGDEWSSAWVALAMCGSSFVIAGAMSKGRGLAR